jgi:hypothetical protein
VDAAEGTLDAPAVTGEKLSGKAYDYTTNAVIAGATLSTDGITPAMSATSGADGAYAIAGLASGSKLFLSATATNYAPTRNIATSVAAVDVVQDVFALTKQDIKNQYTGVGLAQTASTGKAFVMVELRTADGTAIAGVTAANVKLLDDAAAPVTIAGTYFVNSTGLADTTLTASAVSTFPAGTTPRARVALLGVPPGTYTLSVTYTPAAPPDVTLTSKITVVADAALLARTGMTGADSTATDPSFKTDIYPKLQKAANGGLGCANCHTAGGPGAVLQYDLLQDQVLIKIKALPGVLDLTTPANSLLLKRPLYEAPPAPQDHPNATFIDTSDPDYKLFLLWITKGAKP